MFTTELGGANYFGTIVAYSLPTALEPVRLNYEVKGGLLHISWPASHSDCLLEWAEQVNSVTWTRVTEVTGINAAVPLGASTRFFRLTRPQ